MVLKVLKGSLELKNNIESDFFQLEKTTIIEPSHQPSTHMANYVPKCRI